MAGRRAAEQDGVASRHQLQQWGLTRFDVRTEVRAGRWRQPTAHTVATHTGTLTLKQRWWVAVLETGCADAALDGVTALQAAGLTGIDGTTLLSCRHGSRPRPVPGATVRASRWRYPEDVSMSGIPRVRPAAAAIRAALWAHSDRQAALVIVAVVQQRLTTPGRLHGQLARIVRHERRRWLAQLLHDVAGGVQALGELDFAQLCRHHGLPEPSRQVARRTRHGRCYLDTRFDEYAVAVEIDGIQHEFGLAPVDDALRQNAVVLDGDVVLRIPVLGLRVVPALFMGQLGDTLARRGWRPAA